LFRPEGSGIDQAGLRDMTLGWCNLAPNRAWRKSLRKVKSRLLSKRLSVGRSWCAGEILLLRFPGNCRTPDGCGSGQDRALVLVDLSYLELNACAVAVRVGVLAPVDDKIQSVSG
jgi:hypothetical protein